MWAREKCVYKLTFPDNRSTSELNRYKNPENITAMVIESIKKSIKVTLSVTKIESNQLDTLQATCYLFIKSNSGFA